MQKSSLPSDFSVSYVHQLIMIDIFDLQGQFCFEVSEQIARLWGPETQKGLCAMIIEKLHTVL